MQELHVQIFSVQALPMDKFLKRKAHDEINSESDTETEEIVQKNKLRKYDVEYIRFGFIESVSNANRPQCLLCHKLLSNEALKPAKLQRHLTTPHPQFATKPKSFFERKKDAYLKETTTFKMSITSNYKLLQASYLVALKVACAKKAHNIAEELVLPCAIDMCEAVLDGKCAVKLNAVPLSDNTIVRRIEDMSKDIKSQLIDRVKISFFALQLDESTDITSESQFMVYVRYCWESEMLEDFLFCYPMPTRTTGEEVFKVLDSFLFQSGLLWSQCIGICTDGVVSMTGIHSGVVGYIKKVAPNVTATHCMIHREALVAKKMNASLSKVLSCCIKVINFIKTRPLYSRFFAILCGEMGAEHSSLLLHTEVRWLSRGKTIQRLFELREELLMFLCDYNAELASIMADKIWLCKVAYLADIFNKLNELNLSLQGRNSNILFSRNELEELAEISCDRTLKISFMQQPLSKFWLTVASEYSLLSRKILLLFATTYFCEAGFLALTNLKNKYRSRLAPESDLYVRLSLISPRIDSLCKAKQTHPSH
uniref:DUF4371 domain-containing protein n=1 Tax=Octopus bimaculoides TaxID=37653 RepID=A0A0L8FVS6_OCTBM